MKQALTHLKAADPVLGRIIDEVGPYAIEFLPPSFDTMVKAIVLQQVSGKAAGAIFGRLRAAAGNGGLMPQDVLRLTTRKMKAIGLSRQKIDYIRELACRIVSGELELEALANAPDELVYERLTALKGIGPWTVQMFLIFALGRLDVMPSGDLGIRAAVRKAYGFEKNPTPAEVDQMARMWRPYCTVASWYLWRSLEAKAGL